MPPESTDQRPAAVLGGADLLQRLTDWLARFIITVSDADHDLLALWAVHTWVAEETYTTPRLQLDSPMPGSGKTTTLEHLRRLCRNPVQMAAISSSALLARLLENGIRTLLIDEADRTLSKDNPLTGDVLAILNSGYKRGASRPVLVPVKGGSWEAKEMPTYAPVAIAGNNPDLPDDTRSRIVRVLLLPDLDGNAEDSDWELIEDQAANLAAAVEHWADSIRADLATCRPALPDGISGRFREKWAPLRRVAELAGGRWPATVDRMALHDRDQWQADQEDGMIREKPAVLLLKHLAEVWPDSETFAPTADLLARLEQAHPSAWGSEGPFGKPITAQRMGRMLVSSYKVNSGREDATGPRGYTLGSLLPVWSRMQIRPPEGTGKSGSTGSTGTGAEPVEPVEPVVPVTAPTPVEPAFRQADIRSAVPESPTARPCGHPGDPATRCGTCVAESANRQAEAAVTTWPRTNPETPSEGVRDPHTPPECRFCGRPATQPDGYCDRADRDHVTARRYEQRQRPGDGDAA